MSDSVPIRKLPSGVPGLDDVLGGGIPEFSFNLIAGGPGCGKTTLGHQITFANATPARKAVYFSIIGEPPIKMLRYQQQYSFFDVDKIGDGSVRFIHLGQEALDGGLGKVLDAIVQELDTSNPAIVVVDSFRAMVRGTLAGPDGEMELTDFMQRLALALTPTRPPPCFSGSTPKASTTARCSPWPTGSCGSHRRSIATPSSASCR